MFGLHYFRYEAADRATTPEGTNVDTSAVAALVAKAVDAVRERPTCLHAIKDTAAVPFPQDFY